MRRAAVLHAPEQSLGSVSAHELAKFRSYRETKPAFISLTGDPYPGLLEGLDPDRLVKSHPQELAMEAMSLFLTDTVAWTVVGAPTPGWAGSIGVADVAELWDAVAVAMRLDAADPEAVWRDHVDKLKQRAAVLNAHAFDAVRYRGPSIDVTIGLVPGSMWYGGSGTNADGTEFVPNLPTEEVFVSPDWRRAEGRVTATAPFSLMGTIVEDLELEFRDGTIVGAKAGRGEAEVQAQFDQVSRSRHLGEVAIVDADSRVAQTGLVFKDMLYDENVGSHVAWGMGFPFTQAGASDMSPEDQIASGLNLSGTHVDVVVGSPEVQIDGIHTDGSVVAIIHGNEFVLHH